MSLNFLKWQQGTADFKQELGLTLLLFVISLIFICRETNQEGKRLALSGGILALFVFVPVTAVFLMMGYTGFYDWDDLQLMIPFAPVLALGACLMVERLSGTRALGAEAAGMADKPAQVQADGKETAVQIPVRRLPAAAAAACAIFLLLAATNFHVFDAKEASDGYGIPAEALEVYESLKEVAGGEEMTILADGDLLQYIRLYDADWYPAYGRDLWDSHAAGYVEYTYGTETEIYEILASSSMTGKNADTLALYVEEAQPDCLIVLKGWETALAGKLPDYNLVTLTEQYIGYVKMDD